MNAYELIAWLVTAVVAVPLIVVTVECLFGLWQSHGVAPTDSAARPSCVVLIPAHNEGTNLIPTLNAVANQLTAGDRIVVVADNCSDDTALVAKGEEVICLERSDTLRRGKGYALAFGRDAIALWGDPPDVVIVMDADCLPGPDALSRLAFAARECPAQAAYRMTAPAAAGPGRHIAAFAFLVKNVVRPLGLWRLGLPCVLTGTGMAFHWTLFKTLPLDHGHIVEDMNLTVDLAIAGHPPAFLFEAEVNSLFPVDAAAAASQRKRWEHGHLSVILSGVPRLLVASIRTCRPRLFAMALDIAVPPLSALIMTTFLVLGGLVVVALLGGPAEPPVALATIFGVFGLVLAVVWCRFGRTILPARFALAVPLYMFRKLGLYFAFIGRRQKKWVRTSRD